MSKPYRCYECKEIREGKPPYKSGSCSPKCEDARIERISQRMKEVAEVFGLGRDA